MPSTYASGGKVFHGRITKTGNKWLRWAFIEVVQPAISCDADLFAYYQGLKMKKGANAAAPSFLYAANILLTWRSDRPNIYMATKSYNIDTILHWCCLG